jgi:hypothetical protein
VAADRGVGDEREALSGAVVDPFALARLADERWWVHKRICQTAPTTRAGAAVKMRLLPTLILASRLST